MDRLQAIEAFCAVVDSGSFAKAANKLRLSPPAVTRAVSGLENRVGARLLNRTTRSLSLTAAGHQFLESARRILAELELAEQAAASEAAQPSGHLTLTAPVTFGRLHVTPVLLDFLREHPRVTASLILLDRVVSLAEEGIDAAIRIAQLSDSPLMARRLGEVQLVLAASPAYLAARGTPQTSADLKRHDTIASTGGGFSREWRFRDGKRTTAISVAPRFQVNDTAAAIEGALRGDGITRALSYMLAPLLAEGKLRLVLDGIMPPPVPVQIVYQESRLMPAKLRAFIDFAAPRLTRALGEVGVQMALARRR
jgi:DNA-binding transcriptional LysR family regulator